MKRAEAIEAGIPASILDDQEVDIGQLVVSHEFARKIPRGDRPGEDYRHRALDRLVDLRVQFSTDWNTGTTAITRWLRPACPYCSGEMLYQTSSGNGSRTTVTWSCKCGSELSLDVPANHALTVRPPAKVTP